MSQRHFVDNPQSGHKEDRQPRARLGGSTGREDLSTNAHGGSRQTLMRWAAGVVAGIVILASSVCASAAEIRPQRPRIFLTPGQIEAIRHKVKTVQPVQEAYGQMRDFAYGQWMNPNLWITPEELITVLVVYLVEDRDPRLLARIRKYVEFFRQREGDHWTRPRMLKTLCLVYDWLADDLDPEERTAIGHRIVDLTEQLKQAYRHSDYNNQVYLQYGPLVYAAIALAYEPPFEQKARQLLAESEELLKKHFLPTVNQVGGDGDGGWPEGMAYFSFFAYEFAQQLEAWRTATGEDLFRQSPGLRAAARWLVYCTRPHDRSMAPVADIRTPAPWGWQELALLVLLATRYEDGLAQWALRFVPPDHPVRGWPMVLWYNPELAPTSPESLPTGTLFGGIGWVAMRSDWSEQAVWALFHCGPYYAGHQHCDQNSFLINYRGELVVDAGGYGAKETHWHNTLLLPEGQSCFRNDPRRFFAPIAPDSPQNTGQIVAFEEHRLFTYAVGDAGRAYRDPSGRHPTFVRKFLFLKPATFVVDDTAIPVDEKAFVRWLVHTPKKPAIGDRRLVAESGGGRLIGHVVLPESYRMETTPRVFEKENRQSWQTVVIPSRPGAYRFIHIFHVQPREALPDSFDVRWRTADSDTVQLSIKAGDYLYRLELRPGALAAGNIEVVHKDVPMLERRPLTSGILPYGPDGPARLERWDSAYRGGSRPGWDIGRPASQLVEAVESGLIKPCRAIELGCGLGNDARFLASRGFDVTAVDIAPTAIARAEAEAEAQGLRLRWLVADVLRLPDLGAFDFVYDRGCYHGLRRPFARQYVTSLRALTRPGSWVLILAGNANEPGTGGPPRVHEAEIREDFSQDFEIEVLRETRFDRREGTGGGPLAWFILLRRKGM